MAGTQSGGLLWLLWRNDFFIAEFEPVIPEQLNRMLRAVRAVAATHGINRAVFVAAPANTLRVFRVKGKFFCHLTLLRTWPLRDSADSSPAFSRALCPNLNPVDCTRPASICRAALPGGSGNVLLPGCGEYYAGVC